MCLYIHRTLSDYKNNEMHSRNGKKEKKLMTKIKRVLVCFGAKISDLKTCLSKLDFFKDFFSYIHIKSV